MRRARAALAAAAALLAAAASPALADGAALFDANCAVCHQAGGAGAPGQFPRLSGRAGAIAAKPEGRKFLAAVLLNGISGRIQVDGEQILGIMPAFDGLSDSDLAAVLIYISGLDHAPQVFTPGEIAKARALPRKVPTEMAAEHGRLAAGKIVP